MNKYFKLNSKSFDEMGVKTYQELWNVVSKDHKGFSMDLPVTFEKTIVKKEDDTEETVHTMVFSTPDKDRHGDIVVQNWLLESYKSNPVLIDSHNYDSITNIIGKVNNIRVDGEKLKGELEFAMMNPKGQLAKEMVDGGFINTSSVGFIPVEFDNDGRILKSELLENSLVSVPANARALFEKIVNEIKTETEILEKEIKKDETINEDTIINTKVVIDKKKEMLKAIIKATKELEDEAKSEQYKIKVAVITSSLKEMEKKADNFESKRRKIYQALRSL